MNYCFWFLIFSKFFQTLCFFHELISESDFSSMNPNISCIIFTVVTGVVSVIVMCLLTLRDVEILNKIHAGFIANFVIFCTSLTSFIIVLVTAKLQDDDADKGGLVTGLMYYCAACFGFGTLGFLAEITIFLILWCEKN